MTFYPVAKIIPPNPKSKRDVIRFSSLAARTNEEYIPRLYYSIVKTSIPSLYDFTLDNIDKCSCFYLEDFLPNEVSSLPIPEQLVRVENIIFKVLYPFPGEQKKTPSEYYFYIQIGDCVLSVEDWLYSK